MTPDRKRRLSHRGLRTLVRLTALVAPRRIERGIARRFVTPRRGAGVAGDSVVLPPDQTIRIRSGESWVAAWRWGEGPAVLLVHGWEDDHRCFDALVEAFVSSGTAVVAFDLPAHGRSGGRTTALPMMAQAIRDVADVLGPVRAAVGHSLGGAAITHAVAGGLGVERVVAVASPTSMARALDMVTGELGLSPKRRDGIGRELKRRVGVTIESLDLEPIAARLAVPALIVQSSDDRTVSPRAAERLARAWPGAELDMREGLGHRRILFDADVAARIVRFVDGPAGPATLLRAG